MCMCQALGNSSDVRGVRKLKSKYRRQLHIEIHTIGKINKVICESVIDESSVILF